MFAGANFALVCLPNLTHGAGKLIQFFGTEEQKRPFMDRMYTGQWSSTMAITEPSAGSDVGSIKTKAVPYPKVINPHILVCLTQEAYNRFSGIS